jgi:hypothetical protein
MTTQRIVRVVALGLIGGLALWVLWFTVNHNSKPDVLLQGLTEQGLPDVTGGRYVRLSHLCVHRNWSDSDSPLEGNAWLMREDKDGKTHFVVNSCENVTLYREDVLKKIRAKADSTNSMDMGWEFRLYNDGREGGQWADADLQTDLTNAIAFLQLSGRDDGVCVDAKSRLVQKARLLLFAASAANAGYRKEASTIIQLLVKKQNLAALLNKAISQIADAKYVELCKTQKPTQDKAAFMNDLRELLRRYGSKWEHRASIERQLSSTARTLANPTNSPDEAAFLNVIDFRFFRTPALGPWVLPLEVTESQHIDEQPSGLGGLLRTRFAAIPFLLSLLDDYTPTATDLHDYLGLNGPGWRCMTGWRHMDPILMKDVRSFVDLLPRPVTRAEIARDVLENTIWESEEERKTSFEREWHSNDPFRCFKDTVSAWYERHKGMSDLALVREFAAHSYVVPPAVIQYLVRNGDATDISLIEGKFCTNAVSSQYSVFEGLLPYVQLRKKAALPFLDRYEKAMMTYVDDDLKRYLKPTEGPSNDEYKREAAESKQYRARVIKDLRAVAEGSLSMETILREIVSGKVEWNDAAEIYWRTLSWEEPEAGLSKALRAAATANDGFLRWSLVNGAVNNKLRRLREGGQGAQVPSVPLLQSHIPLWRDLLEDTARRWTNIVVTSRLAAEMETLYGKESGEGQHDALIAGLGDKVAIVYIRRAQQRLEGKKNGDLIPLPSAERVSSDERKLLCRQLMACPDDQLDTVVTALSLGQQLALREIIAGDAALNLRLLSYANRVVTTVLEEKDDPELESRLAVFKGKPLTAEAIRTTIDLCRREVERGRFVSCKISRKSNLRGVSIKLKSEPPRRIATRREYFSNESHLQVRVDPDGVQGNCAMWPVTVPEEVIAAVRRTRFIDDKGNEIMATDESHSFGPRDEVEREKLLKSIDYFLGAEVNTAAGQYIDILGRVGKLK